MRYYEIRPIVLALLAGVLAQTRQPTDAKELIEGAFYLEDLIFTEAAKRPRRSGFPEGQYVNPS